MIGVGDKFPSFELNGIDNENNHIIEKRDSISKWSVIFFYPKDFTFICPTEISGFNIIGDEAEVFGISGDNEFCKKAWKEDNSLISNIRHPLAADSGLHLANELGVSCREGLCLRATFICDENNTIQHVSVNALDTGRNISEIINTVNALKTGGLTACNWKPGDDFVG